MTAKYQHHDVFVLSLFYLLLKLLEKRKFLIHKSASGKPVSHCSINFYYFSFFAFVVNLIKETKTFLCFPFRCVPVGVWNFSGPSPSPSISLFESENANFFQFQAIRKISINIFLKNIHLTSFNRQLCHVKPIFYH